MDNKPDHSAVLLHLGQLLLYLLLPEVVRPLGAGLGESLLLGLRPVRSELKQEHLAIMTSHVSGERR